MAKHVRGQLCLTGTSECIRILSGRIGSGSSVGNVAFDTGISINQFTGGSAMILLASRNTGSGTTTDTAMYRIQFYYNGDNNPVVTYINGDLDFVTFTYTGGTLNLTNPSGNGRFMWIRSDNITDG